MNCGGKPRRGGLLLNDSALVRVAEPRCPSSPLPCVRALVKVCLVQPSNPPSHANQHVDSHCKLKIVSGVREGELGSAGWLRAVEAIEWLIHCSVSAPPPPTFSSHPLCADPIPRLYTPKAVGFG